MKIFMSVLMIVFAFVVVRSGLKKAVPADSAKVQRDSTVVVIDSGHGGIDGGKVGVNGNLEKDINLSISLKLKSILEEDNIKVVMTRTDDSGLYQENDKNKKSADMKKRCQIIQDAAPDLVVSIHQNSFTDEKVKGAQVFYYKYSAKGKQLAEIIQKELRQGLDSNNGRVEKENNTYYMLLHTKAPAVIVECGFLSNGEEEKLLADEEYQLKVAQSVYNGIKIYLEQEKGR